jgi:penicillin-binding protein 1A
MRPHVARHRPHITFKHLLLFALGGSLGVGAIAAAAWLHYSARVPSAASLRHHTFAQSTRILDRHGNLLTTLATERRTVVPLERMPRALIVSVLAAEDADFFLHPGMDFPGMMRAFLRALRHPAKPMQGASTITQQVIKNLLLSPERTLDRKIKELILARRLEQELSKHQILYLYLNLVNFGHGRYGAEEASQFYFGKHVEQLTLGEAALLAGIPKAPSRLSPRVDLPAALSRQRVVLQQLAEKRAEYWPDIALHDIARAQQQRIELVPYQRVVDPAPELVQMVRDAMVRALGPERVRAGGLTVRTTLDVQAQHAARAALQLGLHKVDERLGVIAPLSPRKRISLAKPEVPDVVSWTDLRAGKTYDAVVTGADDAKGTLHLRVGGVAASSRVKLAHRYNPKELRPSEFASPGTRVTVRFESLPRAAATTRHAPELEAQLELGPQGAVIVLDPVTRELLALVGGHDAVAGFNRAVQAQRQPGSAFKPIVYAAALRNRLVTPATLIDAGPGDFGGWRPRSDEKWAAEGAIRLRTAIANSVNTVAIRVLQSVSPEEAIALARAMGITSPLEASLALALGVSEVSLMELTNAYATFAALGQWQPVRWILSAHDSEGNEIPVQVFGQHEPPTAPLTASEAYVMTSLLTSVVQEGTAAAAKQLARPAAGKTGTSNDARDTWFVGYTPDYVTGVWVGFDDHRSLGTRESGARTALPIWVSVMKELEKDKPIQDFAIPSGIITANIDPSTGQLPGPETVQTMEEFFLDGTAPTQSAPQPAEPVTPLPTSGVAEPQPP